MLHTKTNTAIFFSLLVLIFATQNAWAANSCRNLQVKISNSTTNTISVIAMDYKKPSNGAWVNQLKISKPLKANTVWQYSADLPASAQKKTQLRIKYRTAKGGKMANTTPTFTCKNNQSQSIILK